MFCPKCGSMLSPKKEGSKTKIVCSCGYKSSDIDSIKIKEQIKEKKGVEVIDKDDVDETLPIIDAECPKCKNPKAHFWTVQTRAGDEPETKFMKCTRCKHTWRDYS